MATHPEIPVPAMGPNMKLKMQYRRNMCDVYVRSFNYFVKLKYMRAFLKIYLSTHSLGGSGTEHTLVLRYRTMR